jgi:acyl-CoA synthetase (AMP-forming)/AMP-acid ligase II
LQALPIDGLLGQIQAALKPGATLADPNELVAWCRERMAAYKCPKTVDVLAELPRNPTGKVLKRTLRQPYWEGRDRQVV